MLTTSLGKHPYVSGASYGVMISGIAILAMFSGITCTAVAGDLLRGGYTTSSAGSSAAPGIFTPPSAIQARQNAQDVLARTSKVISSLTAMQAAASKLAVSGANSVGVNGLNLGGLVPDSGIKSAGVSNPVTTWIGVAGAPVQTTAASGQTVVTVVQTAPQADLNWSSFNIGKNTTLDFDQSKGGADTSTWIAFNFIGDTSGNPARILGSIEAPGQVYLIDQNGIIFGGSSQVNVHTLVASSLPIDTYLVQNGLLNNPDDQFLFSAVAQPAGTNGSPAFNPPASNIASGADGNIVVEPGAQITAPANAASVGGRVALIAPNVDNEGSISTPDGQTILAAGLQVGIAAHSSDDATLRGLDVYVGEVTDPTYLSGAADAGTVTNGGLITVDRGDATLEGEKVDQLGGILSTTSVTLNGRIDLLADYDAVTSAGESGASAPFLFQGSGTVLMGPGSVTEILPEWSSAETVVGTSLALNSQVNAQGLAIHMASGAQLFAPGANVTFNAGAWNGGSPVDSFLDTTGQIYLDAGAEIDAQGSWDVSAPVSQNIIAVQLLGPQLADSPLQREGVFRGQTIYVDIRDTGIYDGQAWVGTPLADASGYVGLIESTAGELTTAGGSVNLESGGSIVMQHGSEINVSGGWIDYQGGVVTTSEVITGGNILPINEATPDLVYNGFNLGTFTVNHLTYGLTQTYTDPLITASHYEESYIEGFAGGAISINTPSLALDGQLLGLTVAGPRQRTVEQTPAAYNLDTNPSSLNIAPAPSSLSFSFVPQAATVLAVTPPDIVFSTNDDLTPAAPFSLDSSGNPQPLSAQRDGTVILSPDLVGSDGFGKLSITDPNGNITLPAGVTLDGQDGGSIALQGANIYMEGSILMPQGSLGFTSDDVDPQNGLLATPPDDPKRGHFILGPGATLDTAGVQVDDRYGAATADTLPLATAGGSVSVDALDVDLQAGSTINVSGGVDLNSAGTPSFGRGGSISILAGKDPVVASIPGGKLTLDATLLGYSGATGGSLTVQTLQFQVGGASNNANVTVIAPGFFSEGGFASFSLAGFEGVDIEPGITLDPVAASWIVTPGESNLALEPSLLPVGTRPPVDLSFTASGLTDSFTGLLLTRGDVILGAGASITTDPEGSVSFKGQTVAILGDVTAPGGSISVAGAGSSVNLFASNSATLPTVDLGPHSVLSAAGATLLTPNPLGYRTGMVLPGGNISISGNIVAEAGSIVKVSGATDTLDVSPLSLNQSPDGVSVGNSPAGNSQNGSFGGYLMVPARVDSNGGTINLSPGLVLFSDATLLGQAGGPSANGGTLNIVTTISPDSPPTAPSLVVTQDQQSIPFAAFYPAGQDAIGHAVVDSKGNLIPPSNYFTAESFLSGGFSSLALKGSILFQGNVDIQADGSLVIGTAGVITATGKTTLQAPYVDLGTPFVTPLDVTQVVDPYVYQGESYYFQPTYGPGTLTVIASLIDIGDLSLQNIGNASFIADNGAIRGDGTLDVAGKIYMRAGQIYPPTELTFNIDAYDYTVGAVEEPGTVTFAASGEVETPLSAGGQINVYAADIYQGGVLRAPLGTINLGWDGAGTAPVDPITGAPVDASQTIKLSSGSVTSVSTIDSLTGAPMEIPYGINPNGSNWIDPAGNDITAGGVPGKLINISAANIIDQKGATIDMRGGGDLMSYQFVPGVGGGQDILASTSSYAILPGYQAPYAPYAPFNPDPLTDDLDGDPGYVNNTLAVGQQVYLTGEGTLPAGVYTLLPARYALLPGAFLVTPSSGAAAGNEILPDGSYLVSGYQANAFQAGRTAQPLFTSFAVDSSAVLANRAQYDTYSANYFLAEGAASNGATVPRLPKDSGQLVFNATQGLSIAGALEAQSLSGGLGGLVDISSPTAIVIGGPGVTQAGALVLDAGELSSFDAASLLIGGTRQIVGDQATVSVATDSITVDNSGQPLTGADIILASNDVLTVDPGSEIEGAGASAGAEDITVAGNGALLRVSSDPAATFTRTGVTSATQPELTLGAGAKITGASVTLDSSSGTSLDPDAVVKGTSVALNSGQITIVLTDPGTVAATTGLELSGAGLQTLFGSAQSLSLLSYSSIDLYGTGQLGAVSSAGQATLQALTLSAGEIRGFNSAGSSVTVAAQNIVLANSAGGSDPGAVSQTGGTLELNADTVAFGANALAIDQFSGVDLNASAGMIANSPSGALAVQGPLTLTAPMITGAFGASETISAGGALAIQAPAKASGPAPAGGLAASLTFIGATVTDNSAISLPSGSITLHSTTGDLTIGNTAAASLDVTGQAKAYFDVTKYTSGGRIALIADAGNVNVDSNAALSVAAQSGGGNAGTLTVDDPDGTFNFTGALSGAGGAGGKSGSFSLDAGSLPSLASLDASLNTADFDQSRTFEVRTGDVTVDGLATAANFSLSADAGSITVTGEIDGSGQTGGAITLQAMQSVTLESGATLTVAAQDCNDAGQGGSVSLEAGSYTSADAGGVPSATGYVDIEAGSTIDLSVANTNPVNGDLAGTLHIRAPQDNGGTGVQVDEIDGTITGASSVTVEGYQIFDAANGSIDGQESNVYAGATTFAGDTGSIASGLAGSNAALASELVITPGAEIINPNGGLTLADTWDLSSYRFGPDNVAGDLTLRAAGNVTFDYQASLSDGFSPTGGSSTEWDADLMPAGSTSWSYQITAGADFTSANTAAVQPIATIAPGSGSLLLGLGAPALPAAAQAARDDVVPEYFQAIRTGAGSIGISAAGNVELLDSLATIYTAGTQAPAMANFAVPKTIYGNSLLGSAQSPFYPAQYSYEGGDVAISAQGDIEHLLGSGQPDSSLEMPTSWLYRRGYINPATGQFGTEHSGFGIASTTWWIDFSNFLEGVGALGGGNVSLTAGENITNVDAVIPTDARMPEGTPSAAALQELGGGDLTVIAGDDISGGVYYVEHGTGVLDAGNSIVTNSTRATLNETQIADIGAANTNPSSWLPTTLFLGVGSFDVSAGDSVLLGPVANPFLLPQGLNNSYGNRSYFSTYGPDDSVDVSALSGDVTLRDSSTLEQGSLLAWYQNVFLSYQNPQTAGATNEPWLRIDETDLSSFAALTALMPPTLRATAFSGDVDIEGALTLSPAPDGTIDLVAAGSINGFQPDGGDIGGPTLDWTSSIIDLSDADPLTIPSVTSPLGYYNQETGLELDPIDALFSPSGSIEGIYAVIETKEALHGPGPLHADDNVPVHLYAKSGDISGMTLYSAKFTDILAGRDITDASFYIQNDNASDISVVSAGRDIIPYDPSSLLRQAALTVGNTIPAYQLGADSPGTGAPNAGDIQIAGPGTLEVLAGRNLTLGVGPNFGDGDAAGITSIGNAANPYLPFAGAQIIAAAGLGTLADGLDESSLDLQTFANSVLNSVDGPRYFADLAAAEPGLDVSSYAAYKKLTPQQQAIAALDLFYIVLRDAGRDHNLPSSPGYGNYAAGYAAIQAFLGKDHASSGDINTTSKEIKTESGGDIDLLDPAGQLTVGVELAGAQPVDQGILTDDGGDVSIYTKGSVIVGTSRIFTLRGGNIIMWSTTGNIAAGEAAKTVVSAPPTRVLLDPGSANVETDLAGLATGGGIGVLASVAGVPPGSVDLIAPTGVIDAGDAGIRATGNLNLAAVQILNASNIQAGGASTGVPTVTVAAPNLGAISAASSTAGASEAAAQSQTNNQDQASSDESGQPSIIQVEVLGYGGGDSDDGG